MIFVANHAINQRSKTKFSRVSVQLFAFLIITRYRSREQYKRGERRKSNTLGKAWPIATKLLYIP